MGPFLLHTFSDVRNVSGTWVSYNTLNWQFQRSFPTLAIPWSVRTVLGWLHCSSQRIPILLGDKEHWEQDVPARKVDLGEDKWKWPLKCRGAPTHSSCPLLLGSLSTPFSQQGIPCLGTHSGFGELCLLSPGFYRFIRGWGGAGPWFRPGLELPGSR